MLASTQVCRALPTLTSPLQPAQPSPPVLTAPCRRVGSCPAPTLQRGSWRPRPHCEWTGGSPRCSASSRAPHPRLPATPGSTGCPCAHGGLLRVTHSLHAPWPVPCPPALLALDPHGRHSAISGPGCSPGPLKGGFPALCPLAPLLSLTQGPGPSEWRRGSRLFRPCDSQPLPPPAPEPAPALEQRLPRAGLPGRVLGLELGAGCWVLGEGHASWPPAEGQTRPSRLRSWEPSQGWEAQPPHPVPQAPGASCPRPDQLR